MKKYIPHILIGLIIIAMALLLFTGNREGKRRLDERLSFRKKDKIPYGTFVAYENLKYLFPNSSISSDKQEPGFWDSLSNYDADQALLIVAPSFNASESELKKLLRFVENGNDVFISTVKVSYYVEKFLKCDIFYPNILNLSPQVRDFPDTMELSVDIPSLHRKQIFSYPGKSIDFWFYGLDSTTSTVLGRNDMGKPDFIHLRAGKGNLYLHLAPMAFTNYFLLHDNNLEYYEQVLSVIPAARKKIVWDEYYLTKPTEKDPKAKDSNWLSVLMNMENEDGKKPFKTALWLAALLLIAYVLMEMRRKQRFIPVMTRPRNDSLEFVKTIGRLYHDKGDHRNLSKKMAAYFLEHVRNRYKLPTTNLDEDFISNLRYKTGIDEAELRPIVTFIRELDTMPSLNDRQLANFHKQLESFYKKA